METLQLKHCPICNKDLPISEFGICRGRKDQRSLYCKGCIRTKRNAQRRDLREYKELRKKFQAQGINYRIEAYEPKKVVKLTPVQLVREAIRNGARTQSDIGQETKLTKDQIGDAIASLLLWSKEIRTQIVDETRMYFMNEDFIRKAGTPVGQEQNKAA